jgi:hypothetical protein
MERQQGLSVRDLATGNHGLAQFPDALCHNHFPSLQSGFQSGHVDRVSLEFNGLVDLCENGTFLLEQSVLVQCDVLALWAVLMRRGTPTALLSALENVPGRGSGNHSRWSESCAMACGNGF